jgi:hypothetical protein
MKRIHRLFALSRLFLYLSLTPWLFVTHPGPPARIKPKWIRVEVPQMFTPVQIGARWKQDERI